MNLMSKHTRIPVMHFVPTETSPSVLQSFRDVFYVKFPPRESRKLSASLTWFGGRHDGLLLILPSLGTPHSLTPSPLCVHSIITVGVSPTKISQLLDKKLSIILRFPKYMSKAPKLGWMVDSGSLHLGYVPSPPSHHLLKIYLIIFIHIK